jgi:hypothetical protein
MILDIFLALLSDLVTLLFEKYGSADLLGDLFIIILVSSFKVYFKLCHFQRPQPLRLPYLIWEYADQVPYANKRNTSKRAV